MQPPFTSGLPQWGITYSPLATFLQDRGLAGLGKPTSLPIYIQYAPAKRWCQVLFPDADGGVEGRGGGAVAQPACAARYSRSVGARFAAHCRFCCASKSEIT